ncbi:MAG: tyrosine-type recombinase/integrase [Caldilineaceae bacterium]|nr:tyrosine-type recombinase/integrase [Caldilineaceae bacterium]
MPKKRFLLADALDIFLLDREAQNLAPLSLRTYRARLGRFVEWCNGAEVVGINATHIRAYQAQLLRDMADVTAKNHMTDIKTFLRFCVDERMIAESPADRVKLPRVAERLPKVLTADQVRKLYATCYTDRDRAMLLAMLDTGARAGEFCQLNYEDVDISTGIVTIREGKPRRDREAYLSARTRKEVLRYIKGEGITQGPLWRAERGGHRLTPAGLGQMLSRLGERNGIHVTPHMLRKTFVTTLLRAGVDVYTLQRLSGHKSLEALRPYISVANADAQAAHRRNSPVQNLLG